MRITLVNVVENPAATAPAPAPVERAPRETQTRDGNYGISMKGLLEAGVHFGHQTKRWNPKMRPYIFVERNGIHMIDLQQTARLLQEAQDFSRDIALR